MCKQNKIMFRKTKIGNRVPNLLSTNPCNFLTENILTSERYTV